MENVGEDVVGSQARLGLAHLLRGNADRPRAWNVRFDGRSHGGLKRLVEAEVEQRLSVVSVFERDRRLLEHLEKLNVRPGAAMSVLC